MSQAKPHPTGGFRAYKKINGREYQRYSRDKATADRYQKELDAIANSAPAKATRKEPFSHCGRLLGIRLQLRVRRGRTPYILNKVQLGPYGEQYKKERAYKGNFERNWRMMRDEWKKIHDLTPADVASYAKDLKVAKQLYMRDVGKFERELEKAGVFVRVKDAADDTQTLGF